MERQRLHSLIQQPETLKKEDLVGLEALRDKYPWFSSAHLLLALNELNDEQIIVSERLRRTAIAIPDRSSLYEASKRALPSEELEEVVEAPISDEPIIDLVPETPEEGPKETKSLDYDEQLERLIRTETIKSSISIELLQEGVETWVPKKAQKGLEEKEVVEDVRDVSRRDKEAEAPNSEEPAASFSGKMSFTSWLSPDPAVAGESTPEGPEEHLEAFVEERKKKAKEKAEFFSPSLMAKRSLEDHDGLVTDTLAKVHLMQGNMEKAIDTYRRLALKYPEKTSYYAGLIKEIEDKTKDK